jgi:hypothetical protein
MMKKIRSKWDGCVARFPEKCKMVIRNSKEGAHFVVKYQT